MNHPSAESALLQSGFRFAKILAGCGEGALGAVRGAVDDVGTHPAAHDFESRQRLFFSAVRKRGLRFPARCELQGSLAVLHSMPEPGRSLHALHLAAGIPGSEIAAALGMGSTIPTQGNPDVAAEDLAALDPNTEEATALDSLVVKLASHREGGLQRVRNPATVAVGFGFLLLVGLLVWNMTGQVGVFPEEALKIAAQARRAEFDQFSPVDAKAGNIPDWFAMQGVDNVTIPTEFATYNAVGVRTFKMNGTSVAQVAVIAGEKKLFFLSFPAEPFGIRLTPENSWRVTTVGSNVLAIREEGGICFLVSFAGTSEEMKRVLDGTPPSA